MASGGGTPNAWSAENLDLVDLFDDANSGDLSNFDISDLGDLTIDLDVKRVNGAGDGFINPLRTRSVQLEQFGDTSADTGIDENDAVVTNLTDSGTYTLDALVVDFGADQTDDSDSDDDQETVTINVGSDTQIGWSSTTEAYGIDVSSDSGDQGLDTLTINNDSDIYGDRDTDGVESAGIAIGKNTSASIDDVVLNLDSNSDVTSGNDGVRIRGVNNDLDITNDGDIAGLQNDQTRAGYGLRVSEFWTEGDTRTETSVGGDLTLTNNGSVNGQAGDVLIEQVRGQTTVTNAGTIGTNGTATPIALEISDVGNDTTSNDAVVIDNDAGTIEGERAIVISGVQSTADEEGTGDVRITNQNGGEIFGQGDAAIHIDTSGGLGVADDVRIYNRDESIIRGQSSVDDRGHGIDVDSLGGNFFLENDGTLEGSNPTGLTRSADALSLGSAGGYVDIKNTGTITGYNDGLDIDSVVGNVKINNSGTISAPEDDAIDINDVGTDPANSPSDVEIEIDNSGDLISGSGGRVTIQGVGNSSSDSVTVTINNSGNIRNESSDASDTAIRVYDLDAASENAVSITNSGTIIGKIRIGDGVFGSNDGDFGTTGGEDSVSFTNTGTWQVSGQIEQGPEGTTIGSGAFSVNETNGADATVLIENSGTVEIVDASMFLGVDTFDNAGGTIDLTADANATDTTLSIFFGTAPGGPSVATFFGQTDENNQVSTVSVDASLGADSQGSLASDNLVIINDKADGVTRIDVNDTQSDTAGVYAPVGVEIVRVDAGDDTEAGAFTLSTGPINKGLWAYDLYTEAGVDSTDDTLGDNDRVWRLASAPSEYAHELPVMMSGAQEAWLQSTSAFTDHTTNARLGFEDGGVVNGGAWTRVFGGSIERQNTNSHVQEYYGTTGSYQNAYDQDVSGVLFGADRAIQGEGGGSWLVGLMAGVTVSDLSFATSTTEMDLTSGSLGAYASYVGSQGGFFNAMVKGDIGTTDYEMDAGNGLTHSASFDTTSIGAMLDLGYRLRTGIAFFEPNLSVAAVSSDIEEDTFLKTDVDFGSSSAMRTRLGFSSGISANWNGVTWEPYLSVVGVNDSGDDNDVRLSAGGETATVKDTQVETYAEGTLGLRVVGSEGSYGYLRVDHTPSTSDSDTLGDADRESTSLSVGLKITW